MRRTPFALLQVGNLLSGVGNGVAMVVLPWLVLDITGSASAAGLVASATLVPVLFASLLVGTVVDMVGRKRVAMLADALSGLSTAGIPLVALLGHLDATWLIGLAIGGAVLDPAGYTARKAMLPGAATRAGWAWERANGVHEAVYGAAYILGPGIGGLLIGLVGASNALWATAAAFAVSVVATAFLRVPGAGRPDHHERPEGLWRGTVEGLAFVWRQPLLRVTTLLVCLVVAAYLPFESVILPVHFTDIDRPAQLGLVVTTMSVGGVIGSLATAVVVRRFGRYRVFVVSVLMACLALLGLGFLPGLPALLGLALVTGLFWGPVQPILDLAMQVRTPEELRGRVIGVITSATYAAGPVGLLLAGPAIDGWGVRTASILFAMAVLVLAIGSLLPRRLRELDDLREPDHEGPHVAVPTPYPAP
ncbi:MFS transporter [Nocardioides mangrovi]|uniref:MFS transporter n=1 Tax=Nocardioides mangrovi TaxID=2874580 RepID=A0ABS7UJT5_9ACTN|nr:MFS transporter [Nocardioides mangrovi]MBZ5741134.1 MFS transporter [Nocardioides mangrovi]